MAEPLDKSWPSAYTDSNGIEHKAVSHYDPKTNTFALYYVPVKHVPIKKEEVKHMATVREVMVPSYVVDLSGEDVIRLLSQGDISETDRRTLAAAFAIQGGSDPLNATITLQMPNKETANEFMKQVQVLSPKRVILVRSDTRGGVVHKVGWQNGKAVDCTCEDYVIRSKDNAQHVCKHMSRVTMYPERYGV